MNRVDLVGRLTRDPELRYSANGTASCRFSVAITRYNPNGDDQTDFINVTCFNKQAENLQKYMGKGSLIAVEGSIQTGSYDDKDGKKIYTTDIMASRIEFLESRNAKVQSNNGFNPEYSNNASNNQSSFEFNNSSAPVEPTVNIPTADPYASFGQSIEISDDDLPF